MQNPTPLAILVKTLLARRGIQQEDFLTDAAEIRKTLSRLNLNLREQQVVDYLVDAFSGQRHTRGTGAGSLKHLLLHLRDHAGELYVSLATALLLRVLRDPKLPLHEGLARSLRQDSLFGPLVQQALSGPSRKELEALMEWEEIGEWKVVFNRTPKNLLKIAMEEGADLYVAVSERGAALKARRGTSITREVLDWICNTIGGDWASPYPDLRVWRGGSPPDPDAVRRAVRGVLGSLASSARR